MPSDPVLVTGSTGMLGHHLVKKLKKNGYNNLILPTSSEVDLRNSAAVSDLFEKTNPEIVIHLAGRVGGIQVNQKYPFEFCTENIVISCNVIQQAYVSKVKKLINMGSSCMYPRECDQPIKEEYLLSGHPEPTNEGYALAKITAARLCFYLYQQYQCNFYTLIPPNLFGPNDSFDLDKAHVVSSLIKKCHDVKGTNNPFSVWGTGNPRREFLFVKDCADAIVYFMENVSVNDLEFNHVNIGTGEHQSIAELAHLVRSVEGNSNPIIFDPSMPDGMPCKFMDITRMKNLGWQPTTTLLDGIRQTYDFYISHIV